jgi:predicted CoA-binding protein
MVTKKMIDDFLSLKKLALIRKSPKTTIAGVDMIKELEPKGYTISLVHLETNGGDEKKLSELEEPVEGVIISVPRAQTVQALQEVVDAKINNVWLQKDSESKDAIKFCEDNNLNAIYGECVLMFAEPVKSFHAFHRWLWKVFGKLPK